MDQWHKELGNAYAMEKRKCLKDYENVDLKEETKAQKTGAIAFQSQTTGQILYMYYMPLQVFEWELETFVPEEAAFKKLNSLKQSLILVAIIEIALLCVYFAGNIYSIRKLTESKKETEKQLHISDTLLQCATALSINQDKDQAISRLLQIIMEYFKADRIGIFLYDPVRKFYLNKYGYAGTNMQSGIGDILEFPDRLLSKIEKVFETSQVCYISDIESDIELDKIWKARETHSVLAVPLKKNGQSIGFVCVENARARVEDVTVLSTIPFFVVNSLIAKEQQEQLQFMSYWDSLTSMYNRNKYMQVIEKYQSQKLNKVGVIYLDLNGLKVINDRDGHEAGDKLICKAAQIICEVCPENAYRIGGDEFVVIEPEQRQEEFKRKVTALQEKVRQEKISVSIGSAWEEHCQDINHLLKEADRFMYEEKQKYYRSRED